MKGIVTKARGAYRAAMSTGPGYEPQPPGRHVTDGAGGGYFVDFSAKTRANGAPILSGRGERFVTSPTTVAQRALGWWERHLDGDAAALDRFLGHARVLLSGAMRAGAALLWRYDVDVPKYCVRPPWFSAMAQGQAASVLVRAFAATGDDSYGDAALAATRPLVRPDAALGLVSATAEGPVLEEYPSARPSRVLNGWIYALWGLREAAATLGAAGEERLFEASSGALATRIGRYDTGWWTLYSEYPGATPDLAKPFYHRLHIVQAEAMHRLTGEPAFASAARAWRLYDTRANAARAVAEKAISLLAR